MKVTSSCILLFLSAVFANATVVFSDSFNYPDGALTNVAAGIWIEHSGGNPMQVISNQAQVTASTGEDVHAVLTNQPFSTGSGVTLYASFTVKFTALPTAAGTYFAHYNTSSFRCVTWASILNAASGKFRLGIGNTTGANNTSGQIAVDLSTNTAYVIVTRYNVGTGVSTIWLNPTDETDSSVTAADSTGAVSISNFSLRQNAGEGTLLFDDLIVGTNFADVVSGTNTPPTITTPPQDQSATAGDTVSFTVVAGGTAPLSYQWNSNNVPVSGATNDTFTVFNVTTNLSGSTYFVTITNAAGLTNSAAATLTVNPVTFAITYLNYNVDGNSITGTDPTNWAVTAPQVQAIGREIVYLNPDIITLNEIPTSYKWQMTNWANAFFPGFYLATNAVGDGFVNNFIASRWPIIRSQSWLSSVNLTNFGYTGSSNTTFARDLLEAQIAVPNFAQPLHVFVTHLKATTSGGQDDADRRGAEASCVSNFFATVFLTGTNKLHPYILSGDMNEDIIRPETNTYTSRLPIQHMIAPATGLRLTTPTNIYDLSVSNDMTESIRATRLTVRFDYIMPCTLMFSNIASSQVFRTDKLFPVPPNLFSNDDKIASDHLPVLMTFNNPFYKPFSTTSFSRAGTNVSLNWQSVPGQTYRVEASTNLTAWTTLATNLMATNYSGTFTTNSTSGVNFFRVRSP